MAQKWTLIETDRRVRTLFGGETIADSTRPLLLRESQYEVVYYFPEDAVRMDLLDESGETKRSGYKGTAHLYHVKVGDRVADNAAWTYPETQDNRPDLRGYIAFKWGAMEAWYEEDEQVFGHPRDPYHRVDAYPSSRHVRVVIDGETVAESTRAHFLYETNNRTRYYIPQDDVRMDILIPSDTQSICPYKGTASYYSVQLNGDTYRDAVWYYPEPLDQQTRIKNLLAFWPDKVQAIEIFVDGEKVG